MTVPHCLRSSRTHLVAAIVWTVVGIPLCLWLRNSILWVSLMSVYSIIVGHWSGYQAGRAEEAANQSS